MNIVNLNNLSDKRQRYLLLNLNANSDAIELHPTNLIYTLICSEFSATGSGKYELEFSVSPMANVIDDTAIWVKSTDITSTFNLAITDEIPYIRFIRTGDATAKIEISGFNTN